ncbi:MAG: ribosome assembly factor SBDS [Candidatus Pacearchaeota archaeon]
MDTIAKLRIKNKTFEVLVDLDRALDLKKGKPGKIENALVTEIIFTDHKKGLRASSADLRASFGTENIYEIAEKIIKQGELQLPQEYREKMRDMKFKQIIDFLTKNCIDPRTGIPYTTIVLATALKEIGVRIDENRDATEQALVIIRKLEEKLPIKIATKRLMVTVPPEHVGHTYSFLQKFNREKEEWLNDGSLKCIISLPAGMQIEFYDKLNNLTKGSAITQELEQISL